MRLLIVLVLLAGCSTADDCQRAATKLRPLVEERARLKAELAPGAQLSESDKDRAVQKLAEQCRAKRTAHPDDPMVTMKCLIAASDEAAVRACAAAAD